MPGTRTCASASNNGDTLAAVFSNLAALRTISTYSFRRSYDDRRVVGLKLTNNSPERFEFGRESRKFRRLVNAAIDGIDAPFNAVLFGLTRRVFKPHLARKLGFMSLDRIHAPATIVAMKHYFDFLKELGLVKPGDWQKSQSVCDALWTQLRNLLQNEWQTYRFLERYLPA